MAKTVIGVFDDKVSAQNVVRELREEGVHPDHVRLMDNSLAAAEVSKDELPWTERIANWFNSLIDDDDDKVHAENYAEAWRRGHFIVVADVDGSMVDRVSTVMNRYGTVDVQRRADQWRSTGYTGTFDRTARPYTTTQRAHELSTYGQDQTGAPIPVVQEELAIGKRVVQRGGVRVHSYVQERPVEEVVRLREERIRVQRRPVNRPADAGDLAFKERTVDVTAMAEEPVVEKRARVVEEVVVGKDVEQREQTIKETVRRKDVRVESIPQPSTRRTVNGPTSQRTMPQQPESRR